MDEEKESNKQIYAEEVGIFFKQSGMPRMAGRVLGWLMISVPPHQSMDDLTLALQASKGSISTSTRLLIQTGMIERISVPGQRRDHFRIRADTWEEKLKESLTRTTAFRQLTEKGLELIKDNADSNREWMEEMRDMHAFFEKELPALLERWEQSRKRNKKSLKRY